jgi:predicted O-methyltransferase YrrM
MDVKERQLASLEQETVLRGLAHAAARPVCRFLEVGSWCGDSTVILGDVVREYGGHLFCVDWWKGSADTELAEIASQKDVFSLFWKRICREGLEDVVVPVRGPSTLVAQVLRQGSFCLAFLDADHRYESVRADIQAYAPLVSRDGGILCGHDCEGRPADFDADFLADGKDKDSHESVHCGVVCAVGEAFPRYSLDHSIWSVRVPGATGWWEPTNLTFTGIPARRQAPPPPIGGTESHNLLRYGKRVYAVPHGIAGIDVSDEKQQNQPGVMSARTRHEAEQKARQIEELARQELLRGEARQAATPILMEEGYLGFNIVAYQRRFYCVAQCVGPLDFAKLTDADIADLRHKSCLFVADSHQAARLQIGAFRKDRARSLCWPSEELAAV